MKLGGDSGHDRKFASPPSRYLFYSFANDFLTNQNVRNKTLSSNCDWRWPELLPATETLFKSPKVSIIVSKLLEVDPGDKVVPQPILGMEQRPTRQLLLTMSFTCDRVHPHAVVIRKNLVLIVRMLIVLPSTPHIPLKSFSLLPHNGRWWRNPQTFEYHQTKWINFERLMIDLGPFNVAKW